jgi:hypothetical protein
LRVHTTNDNAGSAEPPGGTLGVPTLGSSNQLGRATLSQYLGADD